MVTNAEYQKASKSLNEQYTADSLQNYQTAYNDYKAQWMSTTDAVNKAKWLLVANEQKTPSETGNTGVKETIVDENINNETIKQETPIEQWENIGSTGGEIKQEGELKPLSQEYYNQKSDEAQDTIRYNLNWYRQSNPELFSDYETFKKNFSYDARDDVQKNTLDNWYRWYEKWLQLSSIPVNELYTQYKDWSISLSDLESLRVSNPSKYNELQEQINKWNIITAYDDDKWTTEDSLQDMAYNAAMQMFTKFMSGESNSGASQIFADYEAKMNNPEMLELSDNCTEVQEQMENIQADIDSMKKQVEAEFAWKWASRSKINAIIADRTYDLQLQLRTLNSEYSKYATQYNNRMQQYQNEFQMQLQEYQINQTERQNQMQELWFALDLMNFETNEQKAQREWDYWVKQQEYQNWNINSKDYQTRYKAALTSVQNLLSQYEWIPMERSAEQMAQDVLKAIEWGSDLGTELTKINKQIQQKPEYKYLYNNTYGKWNDISYQTFKLWDQEYIVYNNELMSSDEFNKKYGGKAIGATWEAKPYDIVDASVFDLGNWYQIKAWTLGAFLSDPSNASKKNWGWCGAFVNKYLKSIGVSSQNYYDDNLETKLNSVNTKIPKVWSIAVFDYGHITEETGQNHGHVWIVTKVYDDGSFDVIESNFNGDKVIGTRQHINPQSPTCKWFFDPSQPPAWNNASNTQQSSLDRLTLQALGNGQINNSDIKSTIEQLVNAWFDEGEISQALDKNMASYLPKEQRSAYEYAYNKFIWNDIVKNFQSSTEQLLWLSAAVDQSNWAWDLASIYMFMRAQDPRSVVRENEFEAAAQTMWKAWEVETWFTKLANWERLTPEQRQNFIDVTVKVLEAKKQAYKLVYDEAVNQMKAASIPSEYYPMDRATEIDWIIAKLKEDKWTNEYSFWYGYNPTWQNQYEQNDIVNVGGYEFDTSWF